MSWQPHTYLPSLQGLTSADRAAWEKEYQSVLDGQGSLTETQKNNIYLNTLFKKQYGDQSWYKDLYNDPDDTKYFQVRDALLSQPYKDKAFKSILEREQVPNAEQLLQYPEQVRNQLLDRYDFNQDLYKKYGYDTNFSKILGLDVQNQMKLFDSNYKTPSELLEDKAKARQTLEKKLSEFDKAKKTFLYNFRPQSPVISSGANSIISYTDSNGNKKQYADPNQVSLIRDFYKQWGEENNEELRYATAIDGSSVVPTGKVAEKNQKILDDLIKKDIKDKTNSPEAQQLISLYQQENSQKSVSELQNILRDTFSKKEIEYVDENGEKQKRVQQGSAYYRAYEKAPTSEEKFHDRNQSALGWALSFSTPGIVAGSKEAALIGATAGATWGYINLLGQAIAGNNYYIENMKKEELVDLLSKYQALKDLYGETVSATGSDIDFEDYVKEKQTFWDKNVNIGKGLFTGGVANTANKIMKVEATFQGNNAANFLKGKDANGNDLPFYKNPMYWNSVDMAGSFREEDIKLFQETNMSPYTNLYEGGDWSVKRNLEHALMMNKFLWSDTYTFGLIGGITRGLGSAAGEGIKLFKGKNPVQWVDQAGNPTYWANRGAMLAKETSPILDWTIQKIPGFATLWFNVGGISQAYGLQTFADMEMKLGAQIDNDVTGLALKAAEQEFKTKEIQDQIDLKTTDYINKLTAQNAANEAQGIILPSEIRSQFETMAKEALVQKYIKQYENDPEIIKRRDLADKAAVAAYYTDAIQEDIAMTIMNMFSPRRMLMDSSMRKGLGVHPGSNLRLVYKDGKFVIEGSKASFAKTLGKSVWAGFESNYHDDVRVDLATGLGLDLYDNWVSKKYDPENLLDWSTIMGAATNGISYAKGHYFDERHWLDGMVGGLGSIFQFSPNIQAFTAKGREALGYTLSEYNQGNATLGDLIGHFIYSPVLSEYQTQKQADDVTRITADAINSGILEHKDNILSLNTVLSNIRRLDDSDNDSKILKEDAWENAALSWVLSLHAMTESADFTKYVEQIDWLQNAKNYFSRLVDGELSEEDRNILINQYFTQEQNANEKLQYDNASSEEKAAIEDNIVEGMLKNAQTIKSMQDKLSEYVGIIHKNPKLKNLSLAARELLYENALRLQNWQTRSEDVEESISGVRENPGTWVAAAEYQTKLGFEQSIKTTNRRISKINKTISSTEREIEQEKLNWKKLIDNPNQLVDVQDRDNHVKKLSSLQLKKESLIAEKREMETLRDRMVNDRDQISAIGERVLTEDEILRLSPRQRYKMLHQPWIYSKAQQDVIQSLLDKNIGTDFLERIQESFALSERVRITQESLQKLENHPEEVNMFVNETINAQGRNMFNAAISYSVKNIEHILNNLIENRDALEQQLGYFPSEEQVKNDLFQNISNFILEAYAKKHKEDKDLITNIIASRKLLSTLDSIVDRISNSPQQSVMLKGNLQNITQQVTTMDQLLPIIQEYSNKEELSEEDREAFKKLYNELKQANGLKNSVVSTQEETSDVIEETNETEEETEDVEELTNEEPIETAPEQVTEEQETKTETPVIEETSEEQEAKLEEEVQQDSFKEPVILDKPVDEVIEDQITISNEGQSVTPEPEAYVNAGQPDVQIVEPIPNNDVVGNIDGTSNEIDDIIEDGVTATQMCGNVMRTYDTDSLRDREIAKEIVRTPNSKNSSLAQFNNWCNRKGIKYQDIIDYELGKIYHDNPDIPVYFMRLRPTNDPETSQLGNLVLNVIEYTPDVRKHHQNDRGGVITANRKQYLIIGTAGYRDSNTGEKQAFNSIQYRIKRESKTFFENPQNNSQEAYVSQTMHTQIKNISTGYIVRQASADTSQQTRSILQMLNSEAEPWRNPNGLTKRNLVWGLQTKRAFVTYPKPVNVFSPKNKELNMGNIFLLVPNGKGVYTPLELKPTHYQDLPETSVLKSEIDNLLLQVIQPEHEVRSRAIKKLVQRLYMPKIGGPTILIGTENSTTITIKTRGQVNDQGVIIQPGKDIQFHIGRDTFEQFQQIIKDCKFRINVTPSILSDRSGVSFRKYEEAGVFKTDSAILGTAGVDYTIYPVNASGDPAISIKTTRNNGFEAGNSIGNPSYRVMYKGSIYRRYGNTWQLDNHTPLDTSTAEGLSLLRQLQFNDWIDTNNVPPASTGRPNWEYYIVRTSPSQVIKRNATNKEIVELSESESKRFIDEYNRQQAEKQRAQNAKNAVEQLGIQQQAQQTEQGNPIVEREMTLEEMENQSVGIYQDDINTDTTEQQSQQQEVKQISQQEQKNINKSVNISLNDLENSKEIVTFADVINTSSMDELTELLELCASRGIDTNNLEQGLLDKNVPIVGVRSVKDLIKNIKNCH